MTMSMARAVDYIAYSVTFLFVIQNFCIPAFDRIATPSMCVSWVKDFKSATINRGDILSISRDCELLSIRLCKSILKDSSPAKKKPEGIGDYKIFFIMETTQRVDSVSVRGICHIFLDCGCPMDDKFRFLLISVNPVTLVSKVEVDINMTWDEYKNILTIKGGDTTVS